MVIACVIAIPLGLVLGHTGRGGFLAINLSNVGRAVPSLALIALFVAFVGVGFINVTLALVLLAIPPILTNTYVGVRQVDPEIVDAARGQGHDRLPDRPQRRAAARAAADLRRRAHVGRQRHRHRDDRPARRRLVARRSDHQLRRLRRRRPSRRLDPRRPARHQLRARPRSGPARRHTARPAPRPVRHDTHQEGPTNDHEPQAGSERRSRHSPRSHWPPGSRPAASSGSDSTSSSASSTTPSRRDPEERGQRRHDDHRRLEELHRAEGARRGLRAGARGRRLHRQEGAQPRRREDGAEGRQVAARSPATPSTPEPRWARSST